MRLLKTDGDDTSLKMVVEIEVLELGPSNHVGHGELLLQKLRIRGNILLHR